MTRLIVPLLAALTVGGGCAPFAGRPAPAPDPAQRHLLRPVPQTHAYRQALADGTRSPTGAPGPRYWQQRVDYRIEAALDPATTEVRGREWITYHNQSPDTLRTMVLNLYQNVFTETARRNRVSPNTGGMVLEHVAVQGQVLEELPAGTVGVMAPVAGAPLGYAVQGTLARLVLPRAIAPGETAELEIAWHFRVPPAGTYRTAWEDALGGRAFVVAQWYPQVAVYDDLRGWALDPYLGDGEFYLEYGDFDVSITVPEGWLVGATGELRNPGEVLTDEARRRLALVSAADTVVRIVTEADLDAGRATAPAGPDGHHTWRFFARDVRDFAWGTSDRYVWDAVQTAVAEEAGGLRRVPVHALYRPGAPGWHEAARYGQHALWFFSDVLVPYLYPQFTIVEGSVGGMEYPQLVFIGKPATPEALYSVIAHEAIHQWFSMMVGQDEAAYAWMDEGTAVFFQDMAKIDFWGPEPDPFAITRNAYLAVAGSDVEVPVMRHTDLITPFADRRVAAYSKPGTLMRTLRGVVGDSVFHRAMRTYVNEWTLRRPTPWDFFATFERAHGASLDWFFYPWFFEIGVLDQALAQVVPLREGVRVVIHDLGHNPMPTPLRVTTEEGLATMIEIPVEAWLDPPTRSLTATLPAPGRVVRVEIDPDHLFPDVDRTNNIWAAEAEPPVP